MKLNQGSVWPTRYCISSALQCEMLWCRHLTCPQQRLLNNIIFMKILVHCGNRVRELCSPHTVHKSSCVFLEYVAWAGECYIIRFAFLFFFFFLAPNPLIGRFKSISVNMAEIMLPNLASKKDSVCKGCLVFQTFPSWTIWWRSLHSPRGTLLLVILLSYLMLPH